MSTLDAIRAAINGGRFAHAVILAGHSADGQLTSAVALLSAAAVCLSDGDKPCGVCNGCRKAQLREHPDIDTVSPDGNEIKIVQIRDARAALQVRANEAPRRVLIINPADTMNTAAQNALLQVLEEPAGGTLFILIAQNEHALLSTVRSRAQIYRFAESTAAARSPLAVALADALHRRDRAAIAECCSKIAALKGDAIAALISDTRAELRARPLSLDLNHIAALNRAAELYDANVTSSHISGLLLAHFIVT